MRDAPPPAGPRCVHSAMADKMRRRLKFHFMNPYQKWRARRMFPWKLLLQVVKVVLVTIQLCIFGSTRSSHVDFLETSTVAFKHLYLSEWNPSYETLPYPPSSGPYAIYTIPDFYSYVNYAMMRYYDTEDVAIGTYHFRTLFNKTATPMTMCKTYYRRSNINAVNQTYDFDANIEEDCFPIVPFGVDLVNATILSYDIEYFLTLMDKSINFDRIINVELKFALNTVHLKGMSQLNRPDCFKCHTTITFDNSLHNGQVLINLVLDEEPLKCSGVAVYPSDWSSTLNALNIALDVFVIVLCAGSMILCIRSIFRSAKLSLKTQDFFKKHYEKKLTTAERLEFVDFWYLLIVVNDILNIAGSIFKMQMSRMAEMLNEKYDMYETTSMLLGIGNILIWFGTLRYMGFFPKYNILILTVKKSMPNVARFICVAGVIYLAFCFCGWIVLGPYHLKFRTLTKTSAALFSLINGDDMFATFSVIKRGNSIWVFSQLYLYSFISLFIYVVLSIFIAVIMDSYETIKHWSEHGHPLSDLQKFIAECKEDCESTLYRADSLIAVPGLDDQPCYCDLIHCCRRSRTSSELSDVSQLQFSYQNMDDQSMVDDQNNVKT